jgi:hypothetical protein
MNRSFLSTTNQTIALVSLLTAFQMLILGFLQLNPVIGYWFTYFLPFFTIVIYARSRFKGVLIYGLSSMVLILMLLVNPFEIILFYWLPSLMLGLGYGLALTHRASIFEMIFLLAIVQMITLFFMRWISLQLYEVDLLSLLYTFLRIHNLPNIHLLNPIMLYTIGLIQILTSFVLLLPLIERIGFKIQYDVFYGKKTLHTYAGLFVVALLTTWLQPNLTLYVVGPLTLLCIYTYVYFFMKPLRFEPYFLLVGLMLYPFVNAIFSSILIGPYRILSSLFLSVFPLLLAFHKSFTQKRKNALI